MKILMHQKAIVYNNKGNFLALKASYKGKRWDLPGGAIDFPEGHEDALHRELQEEAGIQITEITPIEIQTGYNKEQDEYIVFLGYIAKAQSENIVLSDEHTAYRWVSKESFLELDVTPYLREFVEKFVA